MDLVPLIGLGCLAGIVTGLLPGIHVNTLAAIGLAALPDAGLAGSVFLLAVGTVHTIVNIIPGTFLGVPEDDGLSMLPAHQLLLRGRGVEAVYVSVSASMVALLAAAVASPLYVAALRAILPLIDAWSTYIVAGALVILWAFEARLGWHRVPRAVCVGTAAMALGVLSLQVPLLSMVPVAPNSLLPLLGGLFGGAGLSLALTRPRWIPSQNDGRPRRAPLLVTLGAVGVAGCTAVLPGLTSAVASSFVPGASRHPLRTVAALSAVNTAHATLAMAVLLGLGRIRTGLADVVQQWSPAGWRSVLPTGDAAIVIATMLAAGAVGAGATVAIGRSAASAANRLPSRVLAAAAMLFLAIVVGVLTGLAGLALWVTATLIGRLPIHLGVRRVHLVAALLAPIILNGF